MESSKILQDISSILKESNHIENHSSNESEQELLELEHLHRQIEETFNELLQLKQEESSNSSSGIIKVLPNNSDDLL